MNKPEVNTHILLTWEEVVEFKDYILNTSIDYLTIDLETDSVVERKANIYGIGLCFSASEAFYIPIRRNDTTPWWDSGQETKIRSLIRFLGLRNKIIGHNVLYDITVLYHSWGIDLINSIYSDTILQKHILNEEPPFGLKDVAVSYLGTWANKAQTELYENIEANGGSTTKDNTEMWKADTEILGTYCAWDVLLTRMLFDLFEPKIKEEGLYDLFYKDETMPLYKEVTIPMKIKGFPIDVQHFETLNKDITKEIETLETTIQHIIKELTLSFCNNLLNKDYTIKKTGKFPKILSNRLNAPLPTIDGKISISKKALQLFEDQNDVVLWLQDKKTIDNSILEETQRTWYFLDNPGTSHIFNLKSNNHLKYLFFEQLKLTPLSYTKETKEPQVDDDFLESIKNKYLWIQLLIDYKKLNKLKSTYVEGILDKQVDGVIYTSMLQFGTTSGRYSSSNPNCLSMDTEILTNSGFKKYEELTETDLVAAFSIESETIKFEKPNKIWKSEQQIHNMVEIRNQHIKIKVTDNHRCLYRDKKSGKYITKEAKFFPLSAKILHSGHCISGKTFIPNKNTDLPFLQLLIACQADSEIRKDSSRIRFIFHKERKYKRLLEIIKILDLKYEDKSKNGKYEILIDNIKDLILQEITYNKLFPTYWLNLDYFKRNFIIQELFYWDGSFTRKNNYSSNTEQNVDLIQALSALNNIRAHKRIYKTIAGNNNYQLDFSFKNYSCTDNAEIIVKEEKCAVWCVNVNSSYIVCRRESDTFIIGNCQNLPRVKEEDSGLSETVLKYANSIRAGFIATNGYKLVDADYSQLEPRAFAEASNEFLLQKVFQDKEDLYGSIAKRIWNLDCSANEVKKKYPELRQKSKAFSLACVYGAEAGRISQVMEISYDEAQNIIDMYFNAYPGLRNYMEQCNEQVCKNGYVKTKFGRIRHLPEGKELFRRYGIKLLNRRWAKDNGLEDVRWRFKNILNLAKNFPIQGVAAHVVNRSAINISREFKQNNIDGYIALQIHDQLICVVKEEQSEKALNIIKNKMENSIKLTVPLIAEPKIADNMKDSH